MLHITIYLSAILLCFSCWNSVSAQTGFTVVEPLTGVDIGGLSLGGEAYLTGGIHDELGDGWLRLTEAVSNQSGYAIINRAFPSSLGVEVDFEFTIWGGNGADGFSIFLFDAKYDPTLPDGNPDKFRIGGSGGSLGYANNGNTPGISGGYLGFGIDEWGNYTVSSEGKVGGEADVRSVGTAGIGLRGSESSSYKWLGGNINLANTLGVSGFTLDYKDPTTGRPFSNEYYRRIRLRIDPVEIDGQKKYELSAEIKINLQGAFIEVLEPLILDDVPPEFLKVGFAGVTGGNKHFHEVRNLVVTTPGGVRVHQTVSQPEARITDELVYRIEVINQTKIFAEELKFEAVFPSDFEVSNILFDNGGNDENKKVSAGDDLQYYNAVINLAPAGTATFFVTGRVVGVPDSQLLTAEAALNVTDGITSFPDPDPTNNTSVLTIPIIKPEIAVMDDTLDINIGLPLELMNVLLNDRIDGDPVDLQAFDLTVIMPAQSIDDEGVPYLDESTGDIILPPNIAIGDYRITYSLCERVNPDNCDTATVFIQIAPNLVLANIDDLGSVREGQESRMASVLDNDTWNDMPLDPQKISLSWLGEQPDGFVFHADGAITVLPSATVGKYVFHYSICESEYPDNCSETLLSFHVRNILDVKDDYYPLVIDRGEVTTGSSVLDNDLATDLPVSVLDVFLVPGTASDPNLKMHADGTITVAEGTKVGRYTYTYTVCELINPANCQSATAVIDLKGKELFVPNVITPNNDGINDYLVVVGYENYEQIELVVFNSWGTEVFRDADYQNNWNGDSLNEDVYYYVLHLKKEGYIRYRRGYVIIKRK